MKRSIYRNNDGSYPAWAWPGGYPLYYLATDCGKPVVVLCPDCANREWDPDYIRLVGYDINWENPYVYCEFCSERIPSAYAENEISETVENNEGV